MASADDPSAAGTSAGDMVAERLSALAHRIFPASSGVTRPTRLTAAESALYDQLGRDELGSHIRLEQEKIGFEWLVDALGRV